MSFYKSRTGATKMDGSEESAHANVIKIIPDNTQASATIKKFELCSNDNGKYYQVTWKLLDTTFKGTEVRQNIKAYDQDPKKADRAVNMMIRLFNIGGYKPSHSLAPQNEDLLPMIGKMMGIKIQELFMPETQRLINYISEVHFLEGFEIEEGQHIAVESTPKPVSNGVDSAFNRNNDLIPSDDIPW